MVTPREFEVTDDQIIFRNFEGKRSKFAPEGFRCFGLLLSKQIGLSMLGEGWNIKITRIGLPQHYLMVRVRYKPKGPAPTRGVVLDNPLWLDRIVSANGDEVLESKVSLLDKITIKSASLVINPYVWEVGDKTGIVAYLRSMVING